MLKDGRIWPLIIVGLLGLSVVANVVLLIRATNDPSFAIEPDYYQKAVDWDARRAAQERSDALGWRVVVKAARDRLEVRLLDRTGMPIDDARVTVEAFHNARAKERVLGTLASSGGGLYAMQASFGRPGIWEYRFEAKRAEDTFLHVKKEEIR